MSRWDQLASDASIERAKKALESHNVTVHVVSTGVDAKAKALSIIPKGAEVMTMSSTTLEMIGLAKEINESQHYDSLKNRLNAMDRATQGSEMQRLGAAPAWSVGSVHAVTEDGSCVIASNSGSQLPAYAYGAVNVLWIVGAQKIVKNLDAAFKRIREHSLPLESERARKAYGVPGSAINKLLVIYNEITPGRLTMIIVKEKLGF